MLKQKLRKKVSTVASVTEIALSILIMVITAISVLVLLFQSIAMIIAIVNGNGSWDFRYLFDIAIELIIAVEFVKMLSKHSMGSAIEVLVFVIAKRVIVDGSHATALDVVLFILAFGLLFAVRKYLHTGSAPLGDATVYSGSISVAEISKLYKTYIPEKFGESIGAAVENYMLNVGRTPAEGEKVEFKDIIVKIETMNDNRIESIEVISK